MLCDSPSAPWQVLRVCLGEAQGIGNQDPFCPKDTILRADVTQHSLLKRANVEGFGWECKRVTQ